MTPVAVVGDAGALLAAYARDEPGHGACAIGRSEVPEVGSHLGAARIVMRRYPDLGIGPTDAINVALAAEFRTDAVLTVDRRHFRAIRPLTDRDAFRPLPDGLDG
ncbi:hypothetical protein [Kitasatospora sp. NPDC001527]|uniref:hypothetical protein n=1 Tax=Kitasatospora sp. NPDC001527 TaxID=3154519 RepID=UPI0033211A0A